MNMIALLPLACFASTALASPIAYTLEGVADGSLAGVAFADAAFTITLTGDTDDIFDNDAGHRTILDSAATIDIAGITTGAIFTPLMSLVAVDTTDLLVFGNWDTDLALIIMDETGFDGYALGAPYGPITDLSPGAVFQFTNIGTSAGGVSFTQMDSVTFSATAIPSPASLATLSLAGLVASRRRR
ncbi:MAG: hypothetical protein RLN78_05370 [Phycisphaerales bacterium]